MPSYSRVKTIRRRNAEAGVSLFKRRTWCSDDEKGDDSPPKGKAGDDSPPGDDDNFDFEALPENVRKHIRGLRSEAKGYRLDKRDLEQKLGTAESKMTSLEQARKIELERRDDFETLSRELEAELIELRLKAEKAERLEKAVIARNEKLAARIPEHLRELYPSNLSPEEQSEWLDKALPKLTAPPIPDLDGGAGGQGRSRSSVKLTADEKKIAAASGMTEEEWIAARERAGL